MYSSILIHFPKLSTHHTSHHQGIFLVNIITVRCPISDYIQNDIFAHVLKFSPNTQSLNSIKKKLYRLALFRGRIVALHSSVVASDCPEICSKPNTG